MAVGKIQRQQQQQRKTAHIIFDELHLLFNHIIIIALCRRFSLNDVSMNTRIKRKCVCRIGTTKQTSRPIDTLFASVSLQSTTTAPEISYSRNITRLAVSHFVLISLRMFEYLMKIQHDPSPLKH